MKTFILFLSALVLVGSLAQASSQTRLEQHVKFIDEGIRSGQITDATKDFFLQSIREMKGEVSARHETPVQAFTRIVNEGIASGQFTNETKDYFLNAVKELNQK